MQCLRVLAFFVVFRQVFAFMCVKKFIAVRQVSRHVIETQEIKHHFPQDNAANCPNRFDDLFHILYDDRNAI